MVGPAGSLAARQMPPGFAGRAVRRAARGSAFGSLGFCPCRGVKPASGKGGGADSARPGTRRMASPSDRRWPCIYTEVGLSTRPSSGPSARVAPAAVRTDHGRCFGREFRHGPCARSWMMRVTQGGIARAGTHRARHVRHRPGPPGPSPACTGGSGPGPVAGFARRLRAPPPAETPPPQRTALAIASPIAASYVENAGPPGAFPPAWPETLARPFRQRKWGQVWHGVRNVGTKSAGSSGK